ncbi:DUF362 domain-containing protein [Calycomorphotria hydatis]|nr:DUF362 domain-containing protein [Calycomorphotria hydatis]
MLELPPMTTIRQHFDATSIDDVRAELLQRLNSGQFEQQIQPGQRIGIAVGSRGLAELPLLIKTTVDWVKKHGGTPILIPAMGSHGGGTSEGQTEVLERLGITPDAMQCPIDARMETAHLGDTDSGIPVNFSQAALDVDQLILVNRVKPHTSYSGDLESGLHKMLSIGLGKQVGAEAYHQVIPLDRFGEAVREITSVIKTKISILCGIATVENSYGNITKVAALPTDELIEGEAELLQTARSLMPALPLDEIDLLIVDQIGKNISGTGMDTNIIGRKLSRTTSPGIESPCCHKIFVRGLTPATIGNATGIGYADVTNSRTVTEIDQQITRINCESSGHPENADIPPSFDSDQECLQFLLEQRPVPPSSLRIVQIRDTLSLGELRVSEPCLEALKNRPDIEILEQSKAYEFDANGNLPAMKMAK